MPTAPAPITYAPPILWAAARALITTIFALFGEPSVIAAQHTHRQSERTLLLKWLRAGEALMRHLLLIEATKNNSLAPLTFTRGVPCQRPCSISKNGPPSASNRPSNGATGTG